jgi:hypothetical protein
LIGLGILLTGLPFCFLGGEDRGRIPDDRKATSPAEADEMRTAIRQ